jgi:hypothetical protein
VGKTRRSVLPKACVLVDAWRPWLSITVLYISAYSTTITWSLVTSDRGKSPFLRSDRWTRKDRKLATSRPASTSVQSDCVIPWWHVVKPITLNPEFYNPTSSSQREMWNHILLIDVVRWQNCYSGISVNKEWKQTDEKCQLAPHAFCHKLQM